VSDFCLGIIANTGKKRVAEVLPSFLTRLDEKGYSFIVSSDLARVIDLSGCRSAPAERVADQADFILSFGGDGTFLQTARLIAPREVPIIGVNLGRFGYLAEVSVEELGERIEDLRAGRFTVQDRLMLQVEISGEESASPCPGLNDVVVDKGGFPRSILLETSVDGEYLNNFTADGLIVASPTGSTGYSLSVGGPILEPGSDGLIINPISPHMLANRPLVIRGDRTIEITAFSEAGTFQVSVDGQKMLTLKSGSKVMIKRAPFATRLVVFNDFSFYDLLRNKLYWRARHNDL